MKKSQEERSGYKQTNQLSAPALAAPLAAVQATPAAVAVVAGVTPPKISAGGGGVVGAGSGLPAASWGLLDPLGSGWGVRGLT